MTVRHPPDSSQEGSGRRESTALAMERSAQKLYRFLLRRLRQPEDSDDLLQTIFLRFWQNPRHELIEKPEAYLYQIASNVLAEFKLRQSRSLVTFDSDTVGEYAEHLSEAHASSDELSETLILNQQLERVLAQIPPMYRAALLLRTCDGLSFDEIGIQLKISKKTAKTYVSRALACCRMADWNR